MKRLKGAVKYILRTSGYEIISIRQPTPQNESFLPDYMIPSSPRAHVIVVGTAKGGLYGPGKGRPEAYFPFFQWELFKHDVAAFFYENERYFKKNLKQHRDARKTVIIPVYNEELPETSRAAFNIIHLASVIPRCIVYNSPDTGSQLADKAVFNKLLLDVGIAVPSMATGGQFAARPLFSMEATGSHRPVSVIPVGARIDHSRYNTEFVDTRYTFNGEVYYVSLRALAVGGEIVAAYPRARRVTENDASVHTSDTPLNPELLSYLYDRLIVDNRERLHELCQRIGGVLGRGFYAHDILPASDGRLLVCESGLKFDDDTYRRRLYSVSHDLPFLADVLLLRCAVHGARVVAADLI